MNTHSQPRLCRSLRTKKMYVPEQAPEVLEQAAGELTGEPHCWCNRTMNEVGVDDRPVTLSRCVAGRSCYE